MMSVRSLVSIFFILHAANDCVGYRILGVFPMAAPSHWFLGNTLMTGIAEAGHDVTMISPYPNKNPPKNGKWKEIVLDGIVEEFTSSCPDCGGEVYDQIPSWKRHGRIHRGLEDFKKVNVTAMIDGSPYLAMHFVHGLGAMTIEPTMSHPKVRTLLASDEKFDVVIVSEFLNDAFKGFAKHFDAHLVLFFNLGANPWFNHLVGNPSLPSYDPEILLHLPPRMSFIQRLQNTIFRITQMTYKHLLRYPEQDKLMQKYFPNPGKLNDIMYNVSLVLLNSHLSLNTPVALVPNMVEIGGFHINPSKKLPDELDKFMNDSKNGVIYFSFGSNFKSNVMLVNKLDALTKAFAKRKENILWKWEDDVLPNQPKNVRIGKWLPQQDILAHPNVVAFITHGGFLSTTEAVHHGVPIIAIPLIGDQKTNAVAAEHAGYGLILNFNEISEEKVGSTLDELISNPKYKDAAKERSRILRDRQIKPIDDAVYWIEYVVRHQGAKHLRVPYIDLVWYQYFLLDVFGFIISILLAVFLILKRMFSWVFSRKPKISPKKVKTN